MSSFYDQYYTEGSSYQNVQNELLNNKKEIFVYKDYFKQYESIGYRNYVLERRSFGDIAYDFSMIVKYVDKTPDTKEELLQNIKFKFEMYDFIVDEEYDDIICIRLDNYRWKISTVVSSFPKPLVAMIYSGYRFIITEITCHYDVEYIGIEEKSVILSTKYRRKLAASNYKLHIKNKIFYIFYGTINQTLKDSYKDIKFEETYDGKYI